MEILSYTRRIETRAYSLGGCPPFFGVIIMAKEIPDLIAAERTGTGKGAARQARLNLKVEGQEDVRVICRGVQRDVVKDLPTHVDFMRLSRTSEINLFIPVTVSGEEEAPGIKRGGLLSMVRPEIELIVTAGDIPEAIALDVSTGDIGDVYTISNINLPEGARPVIDRDFVIANIAAPAGLGSSDDDADDAAEGGEDAPAAEE